MAFPDDNATNLDGENYKIVIKKIIKLTNVHKGSRQCQGNKNCTENCLFSCPAQQISLTALVNYGLF